MLKVEELAGVSELRCGFSTEGEETSRAPLNGVAEARDGKETLGAPVAGTVRSSVRCVREWSIFWDLLGLSEPAFRTLCVSSLGSEMQGASGRKIGRAGSGETKGML